MSALLERLAEARRTGDVGAVLDAIPYARFLGLAALEREGERCVRLGYAEHLIGNPALPALHGGTLGALIESTAIFQVLAEPGAPLLALPKTITLTVEYLRSARPADTFARGVITRHGRRVASVHVTAWQEDRSRPVAAGTVHLLVRSRGDEPGPEVAGREDARQA